MEVQKCKNKEASVSFKSLVICNISGKDLVMRKGSIAIFTPLFCSFKGGGVYVRKSRYISDQAVANNTGLVRHGSCYRCIEFEIYCASNSSSFVTLVLPNGREISGTTPSEINYQSRTSSFQQRGIYTCRMNDSNGHPVDMSVGVYTSFR